jgi:hypothetical protein
MYGQNTIEENNMDSIIEIALDLFDAGFNVMITAAGVGIISDEEVAQMVAESE